MTSDAIILAVPIVAGCVFMLVMLYVTVEEALQNRRGDDL